MAKFVGGNGLLLGTPAVTVSPTSPIAAELQQILTIFHNETTKLQQYVAVLERKMIDGETTLQQKLNKSEEQVYKLSTELQAEKTKRMQLQRDTDDLVLKFYNLSLSYNSIASKTHLLQNENTVMKNDIRNLTGVLSGVNFSSILLNPSHLQQKQGPARCPDGYSNPLNGTCYLLSHDKESWVNAVVSCQLLGGHLVEVETKVEADHLKTIVQSKGSIYWIALSNKRDQSSWEWATSHKKLISSSFKDWAPGEPDNHGGHNPYHEESCVAMHNDPKIHYQFQWADLECNINLLYLCEAQIVPILPFVGRR